MGCLLFRLHVCNLFCGFVVGIQGEVVGIQGEAEAGDPSELAPGGGKHSPRSRRTRGQRRGKTGQDVRDNMHEATGWFRRHHGDHACYETDDECTNEHTEGKQAATATTMAKAQPPSRQSRRVMMVCHRRHCFL